MALLSWNLYFHDILNKIKKNIPALNCIFLYIWFEWIVHTNAKMIEQIIKKCNEHLFGEKDIKLVFTSISQV